MNQFLLEYVNAFGFLVVPIVVIISTHNILAKIFGPMIGTNRLTRLLYYTFGFIGVPCHEISHALAAWLFGHKVTKIKLFGIGEGGLSGYVLHSWNPRSLYQRQGLFWIGISPLIVTLVAVSMIADATFELGTVRGWQHVAWHEVLLVGMIAFYCIPSVADLKNAMRGAVVVALVAPVTLVIAPYIGSVESIDRGIDAYLNGLWGVLLFSIFGWLLFISLSLLEIGFKSVCRLFW